MKTLIIYKSIHHGNTKQIAEVISKTMAADMLQPHEVDFSHLESYDLLGFGSGIYFSSHHRTIIGLVNKLPDGNEKNTFVFSTTGLVSSIFSTDLKKMLNLKGYKIISDFSCRGYVSFGPIGTLNKGRPNKGDLEHAKQFAENLKYQLL